MLFLCPGSVFCIDTVFRPLLLSGSPSLWVCFIWRKNLTTFIYQVPTIGWEHSTKEGQKRWQSILYSRLGTDLGHQTSTCALKVLVTSSPTHCPSGVQLETVWILQGCRGKVRRARVSKLQACKEDVQATPSPPCWTHNAFLVPTPQSFCREAEIEAINVMSMLKSPPVFLERIYTPRI